jgi:uncharacterized membrane protein
MTSVSTTPRTNTLALVSFIAAFMIPVAGFILAVFALRQLRAPGNRETGAGLARWALVIAPVGALIQLIFIGVWITLFFSALNGQAVGS